MDPVTLLPLVLLGVVFYFLIIRPQKKRQREQADLLKSLTPGTEVMTTAGVFGTIATVSEERYGLQIAPGVVIEILPAAVAKVVAPVLPEALEPGIDDSPSEKA